MLFHAQLVVSPSAYISLKNDSHGLASHYVDICLN